MTTNYKLEYDAELINENEMLRTELGRKNLVIKTLTEENAKYKSKIQSLIKDREEEKNKLDEFIKISEATLNMTENLEWGKEKVIQSCKEVLGFLNSIKKVRFEHGLANLKKFTEQLSEQKPHATEKIDEDLILLPDLSDTVTSTIDMEIQRIVMPSIANIERNQALKDIIRLVVENNARLDLLTSKTKKKIICLKCNHKTAWSHYIAHLLNCNNLIPIHQENEKCELCQKYIMRGNKNRRVDETHLVTCAQQFYKDYSKKY